MDRQLLTIKYQLQLDKDQLRTVLFNLEYLYNPTQLTILQLDNTIHSLCRAETNSDYQLQVQASLFKLHMFHKHQQLQLQLLLITMFKLVGLLHLMVVQ